VSFRRDDFPYPYRKVIQFKDRVELHGSLDGESWVVCHSVPTANESVKPRTALFKAANFFNEASNAIGQPNAEILSLFSQALLTFAINASNELVESVVDALVCALFDGITQNTSDMLEEIRKRDLDSAPYTEEAFKGDDNDG
jgi:hypothetical protein